MGLVMDSIGPTLTLRLEDYNVGESVRGLIFGIQPTTFIVGIFLGALVIPKWVPHRVTLIMSLLLTAVTVLLQAPFFAEKNLTSMLVGLGLSGFPLAMLCLPNLPEMIDGALEMHPNCDPDLTNSLLSGMLNACYGIGQATGPMLGLTLY